MEATKLNPTPPDARTAGSQQQEVGMRYWHEIPAEEQREIMKSSGITWGEFLERYQQPDWCSYPDALGGPMGCSSLLIVGKIKATENCKGCDECTAKHPNAKLTRPPNNQQTPT